MAKNKKQKETTIEDVDCYINTSEKAVFIKWNDETYITNRELVEQLVEGRLKTKAGKKAKAVNLGIFTDEGINETDVFLTVKDKSVYFVPQEGKVMITALSLMKELLMGKTDSVRMGMFKKQ